MNKFTEKHFTIFMIVLAIILTIFVIFTASATYAQAATIGYTSNGGGTTSYGTDQIMLSGKFNLTDTSDVSKISIYASESGSRDIKGLIYSDTGSNYPNELKCVSQVTQANNGSKTWTDLILTNCQLLAGDYWIGMVAGNGFVNIGSDSGSNLRHGNSSTSGNYTNPPNPYPGSVTPESALNLSVYATYEIATPPVDPDATTTPITTDGAVHVYFYAVVIFFIGFQVMRKI